MRGHDPSAKTVTVCVKVSRSEAHMLALLGKTPGKGLRVLLNMYLPKGKQ